MFFALDLTRCPRGKPAAIRLLATQRNGHPLGNSLHPYHYGYSSPLLNTDHSGRCSYDTQSLDDGVSIMCNGGSGGGSGDDIGPINGGRQDIPAVQPPPSHPLQNPNNWRIPQTPYVPEGSAGPLNPPAPSAPRPAPQPYTPGGFPLPAIPTRYLPGMMQCASDLDPYERTQPQPQPYPQQARPDTDEDADPLIFVGFHGTTSTYAQSIMDEIKVPDINNFGGRSQLGPGFYTTEQYFAAKWFADNAVVKEKKRGGQADPVVLRVFTRLSDYKQMRGTTIDEQLWWEIKPTSSYITGYDYLDAPISGLEQWSQRKFNPRFIPKLVAMP